jgi:arylsulfatase A-like enzyme
MSWPDAITAGHDDRTLISTVDLFATLLDVAGIALPSDRWGESFLPFLPGRGEFSGERVVGEVEQLRNPPGGSFPFLERALGNFLRTRGWRYVRVPKRDLEGLYRIEQNVVGTENLCAKQSEVCWKLRDEWVAWHRAMAANPPIGPPKP